MKLLRTIADLQKHPRALDELKKWDFVDEIESWSVELAQRKIQWKTEFTWNSKRREERFHPSSFTKKCDYYLWVEMVGANSQPRQGRRQRGIYDMGTCCHLMMNYYAESRAAMHDYTHVTEFEIEEFKRAKELRMCGSADGMEERVIGDYLVRMIQEWKSCSADAFKSLGNRPKKDHRIQTNSYLYAADIPLSLTVYINKNDSSKRAYLNTFDPIIWEEVETRLKRLLALARNMKEPEKHITASCKHCNYLLECKPDLLNVEKEKSWLVAKKGERKRSSVKK